MALGCAGEEEVGSKLVQLFGKTSTPGKGIGVKSWGVLCLGVHGTWRAGGAGAGAGVFWYELLLFQCPKTCQGPGSMLPMVSLVSGLWGDPGLFKGAF